MNKVEHITPYSDERAKGSQVASMFDAIAPAYDMMNRAMTGGLDRRWLRHLVDAVAQARPTDIVDLATGTGDVAFALARRLPMAFVRGLDISEGMLDKARMKAARTPGMSGVTFRQADGLDTGEEASSADAVTVAYGVRNFADIAAGYREMYRILRPGGILAVLELSEPPAGLTRRLYKAYTSTLIPLAGRVISGDSQAYTYLPRSIAAAPQRDDMLALIRDAGFTDAAYRSFTFGACTLYTARK